MEYSTWKSRAFEELYPSAVIDHGEIKLTGNDDLLVISWGEHKVEVSLSEFYCEESENPLYDIKKWAYETLPAIDAEHDNTYVVYNPVRASYDAYTLRSMGTYHVARDVDPKAYRAYGDIAKALGIVATEMNGTVICFEMKDKRIPASFAVSHPLVFKTLVEQYMDYSDSLTLLLPDTNVTHIFAGHKTAINRLHENFPQGTTLNIPAGEWFTHLTIKDKA